jgi:hypothetical protein
MPREQIHRERRRGDRPERERKQCQFVIITRDTVCAELPAPVAFVDDHPLAIGAGRD